MKKVYFFALIAMLLSVAACTPRQDAVEQAEDTNEAQFEENDAMEDLSEFLVHAYSQNMLISEASQMATEKATSDQVKQFARKSWDDHQKVKQDLQRLATQMNVTLPDSLSNEDKDKVENLTSADENNFDEKYVELVDEATEDLVKEFEEVSDDSMNVDLGNFVQQTLPSLRQHQEETDQLEESA